MSLSNPKKMLEFLILREMCPLFGDVTNIGRVLNRLIETIYINRSLNAAERRTLDECIENMERINRRRIQISLAIQQFQDLNPRGGQVCNIYRLFVMNIDRVERILQQINELLSQNVQQAQEDSEEEE